MKTLLVVSKEKELFHLIRSSFSLESLVDYAKNKDIALEMLKKSCFDFIFIDLEILKAPKAENGFKTSLKPFWLISPSTEIIVMSSQEMIRDAVMAVKAGASNYLTYPVNPEEVRYITESVYESLIAQSELDYLRDRFWKVDSLKLIQTKSQQMKEVFEKLRSVAPTTSTVLLIGETGTGKGVLAKLIHSHSNRSDAQFISVHCGAIPDTLIESELFGYEKGAFTGAVKRKLGKFEIANEGTIFLDEIGTITPSTQIKLLQILQDGIFQRLGGEQTIESNVRVIAATNSNLKQMCENSQFRWDLYYRLNVFPIEIPPLRERKEDIPLLVEVFLKKLNKFYSKGIYDIYPDVMDALKRYSWPGNIRELENLMERAYILESTSILSPESFPSEFFQSNFEQGRLNVDISMTLSEIRQQGVAQIEEHYLKDILALHVGKIGETAQHAGISTRQLNKLMRKYNLFKEDFKKK